VPSGAEKTIKHVIDCWRTNKLSTHDIIAIVKSFSGSSSVLRTLLASEQAQEEHGGRGRVSEANGQARTSGSGLMRRNFLTPSHITQII